MLIFFEILPPNGRQNDGLYHYENYSNKNYERFLLLPLLRETYETGPFFSLCPETTGLTSKFATFIEYGAANRYK